jgi:hypothetical protein
MLVVKFKTLQTEIHLDQIQLLYWIRRLCSTTKDYTFKDQLSALDYRITI